MESYEFNTLDDFNDSDGDNEPFLRSSANRKRCNCLVRISPCVIALLVVCTGLTIAAVSFATLYFTNDATSLATTTVKPSTPSTTATVTTAGSEPPTFSTTATTSAHTTTTSKLPPSTTAASTTATSTPLPTTSKAVCKDPNAPFLGTPGSIPPYPRVQVKHKLYLLPCESSIGVYNLLTRAYDPFAVNGTAVDRESISWSGFVTSINGMLIGIPYNSPSVLFIDPITLEFDITSITGFVGKRKWVGGVLAPNGNVYGIPHEASSVLVITSPTSAKTIPLPKNTQQPRIRWCGGVLGDHGTIYALPATNRSQVLAIDSKTNVMSFIPNSTFPQNVASSYEVIPPYRGLFASNGHIYAVRNNYLMHFNTSNATWNVYDVFGQVVLKPSGMGFYNLSDPILEHNGRLWLTFTWPVSSVLHAEVVWCLFNGTCGLNSLQANSSNCDSNFDSDYRCSMSALNSVFGLVCSNLWHGSPVSFRFDVALHESATRCMHIKHANQDGLGDESAYLYRSFSDLVFLGNTSVALVVPNATYFASYLRFGDSVLKQFKVPSLVSDGTTVPGCWKKGILHETSQVIYALQDGFSALLKIDLIANSTLIITLPQPVAHFDFAAIWQFEDRLYFVKNPFVKRHGFLVFNIKTSTFGSIYYKSYALMPYAMTSDGKMYCTVYDSFAPLQYVFDAKTNVTELWDVPLWPPISTSSYTSSTAATTSSSNSPFLPKASSASSPTSMLHHTTTMTTSLRTSQGLRTTSTPGPPPQDNPIELVSAAIDEKGTIFAFGLTMDGGYPRVLVIHSMASVTVLDLMLSSDWEQCGYEPTLAPNGNIYTAYTKWDESASTLVIIDTSTLEVRHASLSAQSTWDVTWKFNSKIYVAEEQLTFDAIGAPTNTEMVFVSPACASDAT
eukprot:m.300857 g.300857  ORF g.300857 m.300857 type:complete len:899 (+) comp15876_c0_seq3:370-3066(+)